MTEEKILALCPFHENDGDRFGHKVFRHGDKLCSHILETPNYENKVIRYENGRILDKNRES
jgi:hypothetical protein